MHSSLKAIALGLALVSSASTALADRDGDREQVMTFAYAAQGQCMSAPGFTPDFDPLNFAGLGWLTWQGTLRFDFANHKAYETEEGTFYALPFNSQPEGQPTGVHPIGLWRTPSECVSNFQLEPDLSFTLDYTTGCATVTLNGLGAGTTNVVTNVKVKGQFSQDLQNFVIGSGGPSDPVVQTLTGPGYQVKRICTQVYNGIRKHGR